jgi:Flp pilus assembly protein TadD
MLNESDASSMAHGLLFQNPVYIVNLYSMKFRFALCAAFLALGFAGPVYADARGDAKAQVDFGMNVAARGLWREAIYRWEKAVEIDPSYAAAYNDLAVAYEHEGDLPKAQNAYEKALKIDPNNAQIRQNYELFKEINDRVGASKSADKGADKGSSGQP